MLSKTGQNPPGTAQFPPKSGVKPPPGRVCWRRWQFFSPCRTRAGARLPIPCHGAHPLPCRRGKRRGSGSGRCRGKPGSCPFTEDSRVRRVRGQDSRGAPCRRGRGAVPRGAAKYMPARAGVTVAGAGHGPPGRCRPPRAARLRSASAILGRLWCAIPTGFVHLTTTRTPRLFLVPCQRNFCSDLPGSFFWGGADVCRRTAGKSHPLHTRGRQDP